MTRDPDWSYEGVLVARTVAEAVQVGVGLDDLVMVGGGAMVYRDALPLATDQILTEVHATPEGDTHYPDFNESEWSEIRREGHLDHLPPYEIRWLRRST